MKTVALLSGGKDSYMSLLAAKEKGYKVDYGVTFVNDGDIMMDGGPQTMSRFTECEKVYPQIVHYFITLTKCDSLQTRYDQIAEKLQHLMNSESFFLIHGDLRYRDNIGQEVQKRLPNITFFSAYENFRSPTEYLNAVLKLDTIILSGTKIEKVAPFVGKRYTRVLIDELLKLGLSVEEVLGENDELQTLVIDSEIHYEESMHPIKQVHSYLNNTTYRILSLEM